jgi:kynurenine aminotransferase
MLSAFMAFLEPGDEAIIFEPFFDQLVFATEVVPSLVQSCIDG